MKIYLHTDVDADKIMRNRGLGRSSKVHVFMATRVDQLCDPYVPMSAQAGAHLKNQTKITDRGKKLVYPGPYAHYQYKGLVMAGREPKHYTGGTLSYHWGTMRGKEWDKRMMADHSKELANDVEKYIGGLAK